MRNSEREGQRDWPGRVLRAGKRVVPAIALAAAAVWFALPHFVSAERAGTALQAGLRMQHGLELRSAAAPSLSLWPSPSLTFPAVTVGHGDGSILFEADSLSADFSLLEALSGAPHFTDLHLARPRFRLPDALRDRLPETGADFLGLAAALAPALQPDPWPAMRRTFGALTIRDGSVVTGEEAGAQAIVPDLDAVFSWPDPDEPFKGWASAEIAGKRVRFDIAAPQFRRLLAGGDAPVTLFLSLPGASIRTEGSGSLGFSSFFAGSFSFDAPDLQTLFSWYGRAPKGVEGLRAARATARLGASGHALRFDQLAFSVNDTDATGIMDLTFRPDNLPKFTGTLAFEDFDIGDIHNLLPLADQFVTVREDGAPAPVAAFDIRLSAAQVRIGEAMLGNVAASMLIGRDHALLDIGDSDFEGGRLTGRLSSGPRGLGRDMRVQLSIRDIDLARLGGRLGLRELWPSGPGSLDISLASDRPFVDTRRPDLSGKATILADRGRLNRFDAAGLRMLVSRTPPFPLAEAVEGGFGYNRLDARLRIENGAVIVEKAALENDTDRLQFEGRVSAGNELDLTAQLSPAAGQAEPLSLSLGGPSAAPLVTAIGPAH